MPRTPTRATTTNAAPKVTTNAKTHPEAHPEAHATRAARAAAGHDSVFKDSASWSLLASWRFAGLRRRPPARGHRRQRQWSDRAVIWSGSYQHPVRVRQRVHRLRRPDRLRRDDQRGNAEPGERHRPTGAYTMTEAFGIQASPGTALSYRRVGAGISGSRTTTGPAGRVRRQTPQGGFDATLPLSRPERVPSGCSTSPASTTA